MQITIPPKEDWFPIEGTLPLPTPDYHPLNYLHVLLQEQNRRKQALANDLAQVVLQHHALNPDDSLQDNLTDVSRVALVEPVLSQESSLSLEIPIPSHLTRVSDDEIDRLLADIPEDELAQFFDL